MLVPYGTPEASVFCWVQPPRARGFYCTLRNPDHVFAPGKRVAVEADGTIISRCGFEEFAAAVRATGRARTMRKLPRMTWTPTPPYAGEWPGGRLGRFLEGLIHLITRAIYWSWNMFKFTPDDGETDTLTFEEINAAHGVYGTGDSTPRYYTIVPGTTLKLGADDISSEVTAADLNPATRYRKLSGKIEITDQV